MNRMAGSDGTFDSDGLVTTDFAKSGDWATDIAIQSDGKVVAAGSARVGNAPISL